MATQGNAYSRFRRALDRQNVTEALSAAAELEHVGLTEALELVLLLHAKAPDRFGRAALRLHDRYCREVTDVDLDEARPLWLPSRPYGVGAKQVRPARWPNRLTDAASSVPARSRPLVKRPGVVENRRLPTALDNGIRSRRKLLAAVVRKLVDAPAGVGRDQLCCASSRGRRRRLLSRLC